MHYLDVVEQILGPVIAIFFSLGVITWAVKYWAGFIAGAPTAPLWCGITVTGIFGTASVIVLFMLGKWLYKKFKKKK